METIKLINNSKATEVKHIMDLLMDCIEDKSTSKEDRNFYYNEYLKLAIEYLDLHR